MNLDKIKNSLRQTIDISVKKMNHYKDNQLHPEFQYAMGQFHLANTTLAQLQSVDDVEAIHESSN